MKPDALHNLDLIGAIFVAAMLGLGLLAFAGGGIAAFEAGWRMLCG